MGGVTPVRGLVEKGDVDEPVQRGLGAAKGQPEQLGEERGAVLRQVEGADDAQGAGGVTVELPAGGTQRFEGDVQGAADAQVVVFQVVEAVAAVGEEAREGIRGEGAAGGEAGGDDAQRERQPARERDQRVGGVE
ncbi:hypothetical protein, partial [Streptomyces aurantiacus]|uniref:hypothetical protein n=1 Tax=Streptomyces aurantiacus TaxID=47760 RepID=UPI001939D534